VSHCSHFLRCFNAQWRSKLYHAPSTSSLENEVKTFRSFNAHDPLLLAFF